MTRAASSRKNSTGSTVNTKTGPVFRGRDVVFVDPLDEKEIYWWPAMIVPVPEIDSSMGYSILEQGECLVKYFEDNKYSVVKFSELQHFIPTTIPYVQFEETAGQKFLKNGGVVNARAYLDTGKVKRKFSWHRWGSAQDQELSLDMLKHKPINLPLISDESFQDVQQQIHSASIMSSPTTSTKNYTDSETDTRDNVSSTSSSSADERTSSSSSSSSSRGHQKNGQHRQSAGVSSSSSQSSNLLPSPVSLNDPSMESMDETEFNTRSTRTKVEGTASKDSPIISKSRSRRGSRDNESKASIASSIDSASDKESSKRSRNASEQSSSSSSNSTSSVTPQNVSNTSSESISSSETIKKRKTASEHSNIQIGTSDVGSISSRSSRQGSVEPSTSPRSTRHSFRNLKLSENGQQGPNEDTSESPQDGIASAKLQTHRMTRQRSSPKSANSISILPPCSIITQEKSGGVKGELTVQELSKNGHPMDQSHSDDSTAMDVDTQESSTESNSKEQSSSTAPSVSTASSTPSPSSTGLEEGLGISPTSLTSTHRDLLLTLEQDRREMNYSFGHVLPTLAIGSKEREAFYETCMDHLQKLRHEHRKLKDILKHSDYVPKGRRATRSLPQQHGHHRNNHHHLEDKPNRKNSPAPTRNGSNKESRASLTKMDSETGDESTASTPIAQQPYQGSAPSSAILTSNISTTTRRSAATAAAAAVTATVSRASRQSHNNNNNSNASQSGTEKSIETSYGKKRGSATAAAVAAAAAAAAAEAASLAANDNSPISTRAKRRQR
ncbi:hypothetical protein BGZ76_000216 [Entomortierella beljakovae]|nr:hypothetical protein BGZ76_000216 [Entomortierella beljakovae]